MLSLTQEQFSKLKPLILSPEIVNAESDMYLYKGNYKDEKVLKIYLDKRFINIPSKEYTCNMLMKYRYQLGNNFCIPDDLLEVLYTTKKGIVLPKINGNTLLVVLKNPYFRFPFKINALSRMGEVISKMDEIRKEPELDNFYIGDLNSHNCMVSSNGNITIVDLDSCRIGDNEMPTSKHLVYSAFINDIPEKYKQVDPFSQKFEIDKNTELLCYSLIVLEFIAGQTLFLKDIESLNQLLEQLEDSGIDKELIDIFSKLNSQEDNQNPFEHVKTLTKKQVRTFQEKYNK